MSTEMRQMNSPEQALVKELVQFHHYDAARQMKGLRSNVDRLQRANARLNHRGAIAAVAFMFCYVALIVVSVR